MDEDYSHDPAQRTPPGLQFQATGLGGALRPPRAGSRRQPVSRNCGPTGVRSASRWPIGAAVAGETAAQASSRWGLRSWTHERVELLVSSDGVWRDGSGPPTPGPRSAERRRRGRRSRSKARPSSFACVSGCSQRSRRRVSAGRLVRGASIRRAAACPASHPGARLSPRAGPLPSSISTRSSLCATAAPHARGWCDDGDTSSCGWSGARPVVASTALAHGLLLLCTTPRWTWRAAAAMGTPDDHSTTRPRHATRVRSALGSLLERERRARLCFEWARSPPRELHIVGRQDLEPGPSGQGDLTATPRRTSWSAGSSPACR